MASRTCFFCLFLVCLAALSGAEEEKSEEKLIGWKGETYKPIDELKAAEAQNDDRRPWIQLLSWKPRAYVYRNFLTPDEIKHLIKKGTPQMRRSTVVGGNDRGVIDEYRTSYGSFLRRLSDPVITGVQNRLALFTHLPVENQEDLQILWYGIGNQYKPHMDSLGRVCTVLMYLHSAEEGGETTFPENSVWANPEMAHMQTNLSQCAQGHVSLKPRPGDALLFYTRNPDYKTEDYHSTHWACPVIKGFKWSAVAWIHGTPFRPEELKKPITEDQINPPDAGFCEDYSEAQLCKDWSENGECEKNPNFMIGDNVQLGQCRKACKACVECRSKEDPCYVENRKKLGFLVTDMSWLDNN